MSTANTPAEIHIEVHPMARRVGGSQSQRYAARLLLDGRLLCESRNPLHEAARVLIAEGADPSAVLYMTHAGADHWAMRGRLGVLAKYTVQERDRAGLQVVLYTPPEKLLSEPSEIASEQAQEAPAVEGVSAVRACPATVLAKTSNGRW